MVISIGHSKFETEIVKFYEWIETNPDLGTAAIVLWFALLDTWRKAYYPAQFTVAMSTLESKTRLKQTAIKEARKVLVRSGRIEWDQRKGRQAPFYKIIQMDLWAGLQSLNDHDHKADYKPDRKTDHKPAHKPDPLYNINNNLDKPIYQGDDVDVNNRALNDRNPDHKADCKTDRNPDYKPAHNPDHNPIRHIQKHYEGVTGNMLSTTAYMEIQDFMNQSVEGALMCRAIDISVDSGARNWIYAKRIIDNCIVKGILTLEAYEQNEANRKAQKSKIAKNGGEKYGANSANTDQSKFDSDAMSGFKSALDRYDEEGNPKHRDEQ